MTVNWTHYTPAPLNVASFACLLWLLGCFSPDPREVEGAIEAAALAIEEGDSDRLFALLDVRSRHAMGGIVDARTQARALIRHAYPPAQRATALARLGPRADTAHALFAQRCDAACRAEIGRSLGPPAEVKRDGKRVTVRTTRGTTLDMYAGDQWFGLVWRTEALAAERDRASQMLRQVQDNAAVYRRRAALAATAAAASASDAGGAAGKPDAGAAR